MPAGDTSTKLAGKIYLVGDSTTKDWRCALILCHFNVIGIKRILERTFRVLIAVGVGVNICFLVVVSETDNKIVARGNTVFKGSIIAFGDETFRTSAG